MIEKVYKLEEIPEAHRYVEKGHKKENVVVKIHDAVLEENSAKDIPGKWSTNAN